MTSLDAFTEALQTLIAKARDPDDGLANGDFLTSLQDTLLQAAAELLKDAQRKDATFYVRLAHQNALPETFAKAARKQLEMLLKSALASEAQVRMNARAR